MQGANRWAYLRIGASSGEHALRAPETESSLISSLAAGLSGRQWQRETRCIGCRVSRRGPYYPITASSRVRRVVAWRLHCDNLVGKPAAFYEMLLCCAVSPTEQQNENGRDNLADHNAAAEFLRGDTGRSKSPKRKARVAPAANGQQGSATHHAGEPVALQRSMCMPVPDERLPRSLVQGTARSHQNETAAALLSQPGG